MLVAGRHGHADINEDSVLEVDWMITDGSMVTDFCAHRVMRGSRSSQRADTRSFGTLDRGGG